MSNTVIPPFCLNSHEKIILCNKARKRLDLRFIFAAMLLFHLPLNKLVIVMSEQVFILHL